MKIGEKKLKNCEEEWIEEKIYLQLKIEMERKKKENDEKDIILVHTLRSVSTVGIDQKWI